MPLADASFARGWPAPPAVPTHSPSADRQLLDEPEAWQEFSHRLGGAPDSGVLWASSIAFEGMHCAACAVTLERLLGAVPGVVEVAVSAAAQRGRIVWDAGKTKPSQWLQALDGSAYRALPVHDVDRAARRQQETRRMAWRLGVAGLCMMQVMMYAVPGYVAGADGGMAADTRQLLRWAQWMLALPVLLFSCKPFFAAAWRDLLQRRISMDLPAALAMAITFTVSSLGTFQPHGAFGHHVYFDAMTMFVFFLLVGRWLELRLRDRAAGALEALMHQLPASALRQDARGQWQRVALRRVRVGDVLRVLPGETFPADGTLLAGHTRTDEALLTGESRPVARGVDDAVVAGSGNLGATVDMRVTALGGSTRYAQIVALMQQAATSKPELARLVDRAAPPFLIFVLLAAGTAALLWWHVDPSRALMVAVAVLVITCPCALSLATPAALLASAGALARRGLLVRDLRALEALAAVDTVIFDKTGTLTSDSFVVAQERARTTVTTEQALSWATALAQHSLHPASRALVAAAHDAELATDLQAQDVFEEAGRGVRGTLTDSQGRTQQLRLGSAAFCGVPPVAADGPVTHLADDAGWLASFHLHETLRPDAQATVAELQQAGLKVHLLSGDQPQAAHHVARQLGIRHVAAACSPDDKLQRLRALQQAGARTAMVGDGLNDGPVLAAAHVSFAFGNAVPLAQAQSDLVVLGQQLGSVPDALAQARRTMRVVRQNLRWALTYNVLALPIAFSGLMPAWLAGLGMALSSLVVVGNAARLGRRPPAAAKAVHRSPMAGAA